jgi:hypothetical protein
MNARMLLAFFVAAVKLPLIFCPVPPDRSADILIFQAMLISWSHWIDAKRRCNHR